jgi:hypothetical protein
MSSIKLFENVLIRSQWDEARQAWYFSVVDVVGLLTNSPNPSTYWSALETRSRKEGSELATNCSQLKMQSADRKNYLTDFADTAAKPSSQARTPSNPNNMRATSFPRSENPRAWCAIVSLTHRRQDCMGHCAMEQHQ